VVADQRVCEIVIDFAGVEGSIAKADRLAPAGQIGGLVEEDSRKIHRMHPQ